MTRLIAGNPYAPTPVPEAFIETLRARCTAQGALIQGPDGLQIGELVRVQQGPFSELVSRIEDFSDADRVTLLLDMMGQAIRVKVPRRSVERAAELPPASQIK